MVLMNVHPSSCLALLQQTNCTSPWQNIQRLVIRACKNLDWDSPMTFPLAKTQYSTCYGIGQIFLGKSLVWRRQDRGRPSQRNVLPAAKRTYLCCYHTNSVWPWTKRRSKVRGSHCPSITFVFQITYSNKTKCMNVIVSSLSVSKLNHRQHFSTICAKHHLLCPPKRGNLPVIRGGEEGPDFPFLQEMNFVFLSWLSFVYCSGEYETGARWGTSVSCSPKHSPPKQIMPTCCRNRGRPSVNERGFYEYLSRVFEWYNSNTCEVL